MTSADDTNGANNTDTETTVISKKAAGNAKGKGKKNKAELCRPEHLRAHPATTSSTGTAGTDVIRGLAG